MVDILRLVRISGTSHGLPVRQVTIRATRADSSIILEQTTPVNYSGSWRIDVPIGVQPGTPGMIYAFARDAGGNIVAQKSINVTWGLNNTTPAVIITTPPQNTLVGINGAPFPVLGFAANLMQNNIVVRALDAFGNPLTQQLTTVDVNGNWQVVLTVNVPMGTPGSLIAYSTNPSNGSIIASWRTQVTYGGQCYIRTDWPIYVVQVGDTLLRIAQRTGTTVSTLAIANCIPNANLVFAGQPLRVPQLPATPPPAQTTVRIVAPANNAQLNADQPITVTGSGTGLAGNNVIVRALDANGTLLAEQTVSVINAAADGTSQWQVGLTVNVADGTRGTLYAFAQSPSSNAVLADAVIGVIYTSAIVVTPPTSGEQQLIITQPTSASPLAASGQFPVSGTITEPFDGDLFVRVLDNRGNVIGEAKATLTRVGSTDTYNWQVLLNLNVPPGTRATIFAYVPSPFNVTAMIADAVNVIFGQTDNGPFVTLSDPLPYATVNIDQPFTVSGQGGSLNQDTVVVRALDDKGAVLTEDSTTLDSAGNWQISLQVNTAQGTRGTLVAFSTAADGSIAAFASRNVTFGDPDQYGQLRPDQRAAARNDGRSQPNADDRGHGGSAQRHDRQSADSRR